MCIEITIFELIHLDADPLSECPSVISYVVLATSHTRWAYSLRGWNGEPMRHDNKRNRLKLRAERCESIAIKPNVIGEFEKKHEIASFPKWDWGNCSEFQLFATLLPCT